MFVTSFNDVLQKNIWSKKGSKPINIHGPFFWRIWLKLSGIAGRVGHRVLFCSVRSVLFRSLKGTFRSFPFFFQFFGDLWDPKERNVLLQRMQKNAKNATFFCKECKRTQEHFVLLQKNARMFRVFFNIYIDIYILKKERNVL